MNVSNIGGVKVYRVTAGKTLPEWLSDKSRKALKKDDDFNRRIEIVQDFDFPTAAQRLRVTNDGNYMVAVGTYKPRLRVWDLNELSLKFERYVDCECVQVELLGDDWKKLVLLYANRYVDFHTTSGGYYKTRVPRMCFDMKYEERTCDLFCVGASDEIYRINLEQGTFLEPFQSSCPVINVCERNPAFSLLATGGQNGVVECWDSRMRKRPGHFSINPALTGYGNGKEKMGVSALKFSDDGMNLLVGSTGGQVLQYDIRLKTPMAVKDHGNDTPIKSLLYQTEDIVLSCDTKLMKAFNRHTGETLTNIETESDINELCVYPKTGLLCMACEQPKIEVFYIPSLGVAPKWCHFLDNLTEELEEDTAPSVYDDFKFVTNEEVERLGLQRLIGSDYMRAYMHGYFVDVRLYKKVQAMSDPFAFERHRKEMVRKKIEERQSSRISVKKKIPKVNKELFLQRLMLDKEDANRKMREEEDQEFGGEDEEDTTIKKKKKKGEEGGESILRDDRFAELFQNPDFSVDVTSEDFQKKFHKKLKPSKLESELKKNFEFISEASVGKGELFGEDNEVEVGGGGEGKKKIQMMQGKVSFLLSFIYLFIILFS